MTTSKKPLAIDKSFAHGSSKDRLAEISREFEFFVPTAFYYEMLNNESKKRASTIAGMQPFRRVHLPHFLKVETQTKKPACFKAVPLHEFGRCKDPCWSPDDAICGCIDKHKQHSIDKLLEFFLEVIDAPLWGMSTNEKSMIAGNGDDFTRLCQQFLTIERIRSFAEAMRLPNAGLLDSDWLHFRQLQVWLLQVIVIKRFHPNGSELMSVEKLTHDLLDLEYLMLGLHVGGLATKETSKKQPFKSMAWKFSVLGPNPKLLTL